MARDEYDHLRESADADSGICPFCDPHPRHTNAKCGKVITDADPVTSPLICPCATGNAVIQTISDEIDAGEAHLMTRNEVSDFVNYLLTDTDMSEKIYDALNQGTDRIERVFTDGWAKAYFVKCGYETPETHGEAAERLLHGGGRHR